MKYHIITYGCQMNKSDSERIAANLENFGYKPVSNVNQADLVVINACSVRQSAIDRVYGKINQIQKLFPERSRRINIILAGCVLEVDKKKLQEKVDDFWHPDSYFECSTMQSSPSPRQSALVPIMTGCNNFCSYCVIPFTRGREKSRPAEEIIEEVKELIKKGYKEILLLGQNVNSYCSFFLASSTQLRGGLKRGAEKSKSTPPRSLFEERRKIGFPRLLRLLNAIPGDFILKFLTSHPKDMSDELINTIAACKKVSKEIHLPIQSGDNTILRKMNRKYTVAHYKKLIKKIRTKIPDAIISTDIIVGFPGETEKQFENTVKLFREIKFNKAYIAMYSPRPGTAAYKLKDNVPRLEKKRRRKTLNKIANK